MLRATLSHRNNITPRHIPTQVCMHSNNHPYKHNTPHTLSHTRGHRLALFTNTHTHTSLAPSFRTCARTIVVHTRIHHVLTCACVCVCVYESEYYHTGEQAHTLAYSHCGAHPAPDQSQPNTGHMLASANIIFSRSHALAHTHTFTHDEHRRRRRHHRADIIHGAGLLEQPEPKPRALRPHANRTASPTVSSTVRAVQT